MNQMTSLAGLMAQAMPVALTTYELPERAGLILVDLVNGFCTVGMGPLAPPAPNARIDRMISETDALARRFLSEGRPILVFRDTHTPGRAEPPYPPHCERGTGQEELVPALRWLEERDGVTFLNKDVINGLIGGMQADGRNVVIDWIRSNELEAVVFVGICTDICVLDVVVTALSARNHYFGDAAMLPGLRDIVVYEPGCATYDLPLEVARQIGLPDTAAHPAAEAHHVGLFVMQGRGAILADRIA